MTLNKTKEQITKLKSLSVWYKTLKQTKAIMKRRRLEAWGDGHTLVKYVPSFEKIFTNLSFLLVTQNKKSSTKT